MARRKPERYPTPAWSARLYLKVAPQDVALFRFLLEGRDNLALFTVLNRRAATLLLRFSPHHEPEVRRFLEQAGAVIGIEEIAL